MKTSFPDLQTLLEPDAPEQIRAHLKANFQRQNASNLRTVSEIVRVSNGGIVSVKPEFAFTTFIPTRPDGKPES